MTNFTVNLSLWTACADGKIRGAAKSGSAALTGSATITGTEQSGNTLTATNNFSTEAGIGTLSYQWKRDDSNISGATNSTFALTDTDIAAYISVTISFTDGWGEAQSSSDTTSLQILSTGAVTYWITPTGNNANSGLSSIVGFATFDKAGDVAVAGDIVQGSAGTYTETGDVQSSSFYGSEIVGVNMKRGGTAVNPIIYQSAPGDEGSVIIDFAHAYVGFRGGGSYVTIQHFQIKNALVSAIDIRGTSPGVERVPPIGNYVVGIEVLNNYIEYTRYLNNGSNISSIRIDGGKDCVVRGNKIFKVWRDTSDDGIYGRFSHCAGIQCYDHYNYLIENNEISEVQSGILLKDHSLLVDDTLEVNRVYHQGTEFRYNELFDIDFGLNLITNAGSGSESSNNQFHHNLMYNVYHNALKVNMSNALYNSLNLEFKYNICRLDSASASNSKFSVFINSTKNMTLKGNIFVDFDYSYVLEGTGSNIPTLTASDHNVFVQSSFGVIFDRSAGTVDIVTSLVDLQASLKADATITLDVDNPDTNSIESTSSALFTDEANDVYTHKTGSPAIDLITTGESAGCYNLGSETIGPTEAWVIAA